MRTVEIGDLVVGDGHEPKVMSVLNMSENSGYEPNVHVDAERAARVVDEELVPAGDDIIDIGFQSANPKYETKPVEYELERSEAAAVVIDEVESDTLFSLETRYFEVAEAGIRRGSTSSTMSVGSPTAVLSSWRTPRTIDSLTDPSSTGRAFG